MCYKNVKESNKLKKAPAVDGRREEPFWLINI